jgi:hypothetical protein
MRARKHPWAILIACSAVYVGCGPKVEESTVIESRRSTCSTWCDTELGPCGPGPQESYDTVDECREQCMQVDGALAMFWAHDEKTGADACAEPYAAQVACYGGLSCEDLKFVYSGEVNDVPPDEVPCHVETNEQSVCMFAKRGDQ